MIKPLTVLVIVSIFFTLLASIVIYNFRIVSYYLFDLKTSAIAQHAVVRFFVYFLLSFSWSKKLSAKHNFLILFLPVFFIDATTLINGRELIPLRFPFDTLYPMLGIICGLFAKYNRRYFVMSCVASVTFILVSAFYIRPALLWFMRERDLPKEYNSAVFNDSFLTTDSTYIRLSDTLKNKASLIEFYFVGCMPCEQKYVSLKTLNNEYRNKINTVLICDGNITAFSAFVKHWNRKKTGNIIFLYYPDNLALKYKITGYPTEYLTDGKSVINVDQGYGEPISEKWLTKERKLIEQIIKHEN